MVCASSLSPALTLADCSQLATTTLMWCSLTRPAVCRIMRRASFFFFLLTNSS